jgi:hypothetical protein
MASLQGKSGRMLLMLLRRMQKHGGNNEATPCLHKICILLCGLAKSDSTLEFHHDNSPHPSLF